MRRSDLRICLAGPGAFGTRHLEALSRIEGVEISALVGDDATATRDVAAKFGITHWSTALGQVLARSDIDAIVLATPTPMHAQQAEQCLRAGKHVLVEIPLAESLSDAERLVEIARETGLVAMVGHVRRFNPSHQWLHRRFRSGELVLQHLVAHTFFLRRSNLNARGEPRSWTDHLLWHHACHTVDLFQHQTGEVAAQAFALQGPSHPTLGIAMDMAIGLRTPGGAICTLSLSFNNDGPFGTWFRYICDRGTFVANYDDLLDGHGQRIDVAGPGESCDGVELEDREFIAAIREARQPNASFAQVLPAMRTLDRLALSLR